MSKQISTWIFTLCLIPFAWQIHSQWPDKGMAVVGMVNIASGIASVYWWQSRKPTPQPKEESKLK
jgi:hypothetical protein